MRRFYFILLACLLAVAFAVSGPASGLHISGAIWQEDINPGEKFKKEISISIDPKDNPTNFTIEITGLEQTTQGLNMPIDAVNDTNPNTARPFITASPMSFNLGPGDSQIVTVEADIPEDVGTGSRYAIISLRGSRSELTTSNKKSGSSVGISIGSDIPVILTIADSEMKMTGEIMDITEDRISAEQQNISVIFRNTGNTHYKAKAKAELSSPNGNIIAQAETPVTFSSIVPTFSRLFEISLTPSSKLEPGTYNLTATIEKEDGTVLDTKESKIKV
jgi:hypothetical protein